MQVNIVDPLKLTEEFGNILANPVIASCVEATFIVHKGLYVFSLFFYSLFSTEHCFDNVGWVTEEHPVCKTE